MSQMKYVNISKFYSQEGSDKAEHLQSSAVWTSLGICINSGADRGH